MTTNFSRAVTAALEEATAALAALSPEPPRREPVWLSDGSKASDLAGTALGLGTSVYGAAAAVLAGKVEGSAHEVNFLLAEFEGKAVRRVRTPAGVRRFGQPIGTIIVRDGTYRLENIREIESDYEGYSKLQGSDGSIWYTAKRGDVWRLYDKDENYWEYDSEEELLEELDDELAPPRPVESTHELNRAERRIVKAELARLPDRDPGFALNGNTLEVYDTLKARAVLGRVANRADQGKADALLDRIKFTNSDVERAKQSNADVELPKDHSRRAQRMMDAIAPVLENGSVLSDATSEQRKIDQLANEIAADLSDYYIKRKDPNSRGKAGSSLKRAQEKYETFKRLQESKPEEPKRKPGLPSRSQMLQRARALDSVANYGPNYERSVRDDLNVFRRMMEDGNRDEEALYWLESAEKNKRRRDAEIEAAKTRKRQEEEANARARAADPLAYEVTRPVKRGQNGRIKLNNGNEYEVERTGGVLATLTLIDVETGKRYETQAGSTVLTATQRLKDLTDKMKQLIAQAEAEKAALAPAPEPEPKPKRTPRKKA